MRKKDSRVGSTARFRRTVYWRSFDVVVKDNGTLDVTTTDPDGHQTPHKGLTVDEAIDCLRRFYGDPVEDSE